MLFYFKLYCFFTFLGSVPFAYTGSKLSTPGDSLVCFLASITVSAGPMLSTCGMLFLAVLTLLVLICTITASLFFTIESTYFTIDITVYGSISLNTWLNSSYGARVGPTGYYVY